MPSTNVTSNTPVNFNIQKNIKKKKKATVSRKEKERKDKAAQRAESHADKSGNSS
jgi:hypothetical protein